MAESTIPGIPATVTLDVYSGRPNPSWTISAALTAEALRRIRALEPAAASEETPDALGYRAVRLDARPEGVETSVTVGGGVVVFVQGQKTQHFRDRGRALEKWLVETGEAHLAPDLLRHVMDEIAKKR